MSVEIWKIEKNLCRCCHSEGTFDSLAEPKQISDHEEIYCNMLKECFNVQIIPVPGELCDSTYSICNACILRLRDASSFKKQVLCCERRFMDLYLNNAIKVKEEDAETVADFKEVYINPDEDNDEEYVIKEDEDNQESDTELNLTLKNRKNVKQKIKKLKCKRKDELKKTNNSKTKGKKDCWRMKMPRKSNITKNGVRKYGMKSNYSPGALERALNEIKSGALTRIQASKKYKIPPVTLYYKVNEKHSKSIGRPLALTESEEESFKTHLSLLCDLGIPINMRDFRVIVKKYLDSENKKIKQFHNNMPGYEWGTLFLERHPDLKVKIAHIPRKRAHVSREQIEAFFANIEKDIEGISPDNIFNMPESGLLDEFDKKNLLIRRDCRYQEVIKNATKSRYVRESVGKAFHQFIEEVSSPDLSSAAKRKRFQLPITAGKSVSEDVTKYYGARAKSQGKATKSSTIKRGRPAGSKNRKKKVILTEDEDDRIPINSDSLQDEDAYIVVVEADTHGVLKSTHLLGDALSYRIKIKENESQEQGTEDIGMELV